ncbi:MAG: ABC transporter ATP-binding protein [Tolumonas sp.]|nr:ABC transporter ATP-binding protein [Tolumonas sp.]
MINPLFWLGNWWRNTCWGAQQVFSVAPKQVAVWLMVLFISAGLPFAFLALLHRFLQWLEHKHTEHLTSLLSALVVMLLLMPLMQQAKLWLHSRLAERLQATLQDRMHQVILSLPYGEFEQPRTHDRIHQVKADIVTQPMLLLEHAGLLLQSGLFLVVMASSLVIWRPELLISLGGASLVMLLLGGYQSYRRVISQRQLTRLQREAFYHSHVMTDRQFAADVRLFGLSDFFRQRFLQAQHAVHQLQRTLDVEQWYFAIGSSILLIAGLLGCGYLLYLDWLQGQLSLPDIVIAVQSLWLASRMLGQLVESAIKVTRAGLFLGEVRAFLTNFAPKEKIASEHIAVDAGQMTEPPCWDNALPAIACRQVCFSYHHHQTKAIDHLDLTVPHGQICAIMGNNGAGKSSLLKLLAGLYQPDEGQILLSGKNIVQLTEAERLANITCMMQDAAHFQASFAENVCVGEPIDSARFLSAIKTAGADEVADKLPEREQALLGRLFKGTELSGGEWQRVTLARALYRHASVVLLDEPTSALDGWSEQDWFARLRAWAKGRTVVVVTHRVTTAMQADMIHIMQEGKIVESGDHQQLMAMNGLYQAAWAHQGDLSLHEDKLQ